MRRRGAEQEAPPEPAGQTLQGQPGRPTDMTVIGRGARLEGNIHSAGSLRIEGAIKGQITAEGDVILASGAEVDADIRANNVTVGSHYSGNITAAGTLELESSAKVEGNVSCKDLVVNRGAVLTGQTHMNGGLPADIEQASEG